MPLPSNCYELLGVPHTADNEQLRSAFRNLSKELHPDTTSLPYEVAARRFQKICEAYGLLSDPILRAKYDAQLCKIDLDNKDRLNDNAVNICSRYQAKLIEVRRPLSGGELFSIFLLVISLCICLLVGIGFSMMHGREWIISPSWLIINRI